MWRKKKVYYHVDSGSAMNTIEIERNKQSDALFKTIKHQRQIPNSEKQRKKQITHKEKTGMPLGFRNNNEKQTYLNDTPLYQPENNCQSTQIYTKTNLSLKQNENL